MTRAIMMAQSGVHHASLPAFERKELEMTFVEDFVFESGIVFFSLLLFAFSGALAFIFLLLSQRLS